MAEQTTDLHQALKEVQTKDPGHVVLDRMLVETDRVTGAHTNSRGKEVDT